MRRLKGAERISIRLRKNPDSDSADSTFPVTVYVEEENNPFDKVLKLIDFLTVHQ